jgi:hypothetical protein
MVTYCAHIGPRSVDRSVDHTLGIESRIRGLNDLRVKINFEDVGPCHKLWRKRSRQIKLLRVVGTSHADMIEGIHDTLAR